MTSDSRAHGVGNTQGQSLPHANADSGFQAGVSRVGRASSSRKVVLPVERSGAATPLSLEPVGAGALSRPSEIELAESLLACESEHLPVEQIVRAHWEKVPQR